MGLSGGSKSYSGSGQRWAQPFAKQAAGDVQNVFSANQGNLAKLTDTVTGTIPTVSANFSSWQPSVARSQNYFDEAIGGKYLDPANNPGLAGMIDQTRRDVTGNVNSQFSLAGRYGSGAHTDVLADSLADAENDILYQNYATERQNQQAAASAPLDAQSQSLAQLLQAAGIGAELPYTGTNSLASSLSALFNGGMQKTNSNLVGDLIGAAGKVGAAAVGAPSDRRLKVNVEKVGAFPDGLGVYEYDYIAAPNAEIAPHMPAGRFRGVMADEVAQLRPWALGPKIGGFATVSYGAL